MQGRVPLTVGRGQERLHGVEVQAGPSSGGHQPEPWEEHSRDWKNRGKGLGARPWDCEDAVQWFWAEGLRVV